MHKALGKTRTRNREIFSNIKYMHRYREILLTIFYIIQIKYNFLKHDYAQKFFIPLMQSFWLLIYNNNNNNDLVV